MNIKDKQQDAQEQAILMAEWATAKGIDPRKVYTFKQACKIMGITTRTGYRYIKAGVLKTIVLQRRKREVLGSWILDCLVDKALK